MSIKVKKDEIKDNKTLLGEALKGKKKESENKETAQLSIYAFPKEWAEVIKDKTGETVSGFIKRSVRAQLLREGLIDS